MVHENKQQQAGTLWDLKSKQQPACVTRTLYLAITNKWAREQKEELSCL